MVIDLTGEVVPCCYWSGYGNTGEPLGNTNLNTVDEIWNGDGYRDLRARMASGDLKDHPCGNCMSWRWSNGQFPKFSSPVGFTHESGFCYLARIPESFLDAVKQAGATDPVLVFEGGVALPHAQASHDAIRAEGLGRYSVWGEWLYFSSSDNSDPGLSSRFYELRCGSVVARLDTLQADSESGRNLLLAHREYKAGAVEMQAKPTMISLISTADCNIDCPGCSQNVVRVTKVQHRKETVPDVLAHVPYLIQFIWHGGEPFLIQRFRAFVDNFKTEDNPNLAFGFTSNGMMITAQEAEKLTKFPRLNASVSMDSFAPDTFHKIRAGANYGRVLENVERLVALHDAPRRVFSVGMIICKSNFLELADNLRFAFAHDFGLNLSPVVIYPVVEQLDVFSDFHTQTRGWFDVLAEAESVVAEAKRKGLKSIARVDPTGMVGELRRLLTRAARRYEKTVDVAVRIEDPHDTLKKCARPAIMGYFGDEPVTYAEIAPGQDHYCLRYPAEGFDAAQGMWVHVLHNVMEPGGSLASGKFVPSAFRRNGFFELQATVPHYEGQPRGRNITWANYGETSPEGLHVRHTRDIFRHYTKTYEADIPNPGCVRLLAGEHEPFDLRVNRTLRTLARKVRAS